MNRLLEYYLVRRAYKPGAHLLRKRNFGEGAGVRDVNRFERAAAATSKVLTDRFAVCDSVDTTHMRDDS
jgi:hypothetical protein